MEKIYVVNVGRKILSNPQMNCQIYTGVKTSSIDHAAYDRTCEKY